MAKIARLVQYDDLGPLDKDAGNGHPLLLPERQRGDRPVTERMGEQLLQHGIREPLYLTALRYAGVEITEALHPEHVEKHLDRLHHHAGQADPLLLAAGQLIRRILQMMVDIHQPGQSGYLSGGKGADRRHVGQRQEHGRQLYQRPDPFCLSGLGRSATIAPSSIRMIRSILRQSTSSSLCSMIRRQESAGSSTGRNFCGSRI